MQITECLPFLKISTFLSNKPDIPFSFTLTKLTFNFRLCSFPGWN